MKQIYATRHPIAWICVVILAASMPLSAQPIVTTKYVTAFAQQELGRGDLSQLHRTLVDDPAMRLQSYREDVVRDICDGLREGSLLPLAEHLYDGRKEQALQDIQQMQQVYTDRLGDQTGVSLLGTSRADEERAASFILISYERGRQIFKLNWYEESVTSLIKASPVMDQ